MQEESRGAGSTVLYRGELVAGVADEHACLPHGAVPDGDALDELGDRAPRRRRRTHLSPDRLPPYFLPRIPDADTSSPTPGLHCRLAGSPHRSNACVMNAARVLYCATWGSESVVENLLADFIFIFLCV